MHSRARLILLLPRIRGKALKINLLPVILDLILKIMPPTLLTSNKALSPSRTGMFTRTSLVLVVVFMDITSMIVLFCLRCDSCGSLKKL